MDVQSYHKWIETMLKNGLNWNQISKIVYNYDRNIERIEKI